MTCMTRCIMRIRCTGVLAECVSLGLLARFVGWHPVAYASRLVHERCLLHRRCRGSACLVLQGMERALLLGCSALPNLDAKPCF